jgi:hypothetical protein
VKASPKKHKHLINLNLRFSLLKANTDKYQALWYSTFVALYIWFVFWMSYDFFILHKRIVELNAASFIGTIASIAFIWAGTKFFKKHNGTEVRKLQQQSLRQYLPQKAAANHNSSCIHCFGYLNEHCQSQSIPTECLTCESVIQCFSSKK